MKCIRLAAIFIITFSTSVLAQQPQSTNQKPDAVPHAEVQKPNPVSPRTGKKEIDPEVAQRR